MRCPFCGHEDTQVKDSRPTDDNSAIRRRRYCPSCGSRFTTFERVQLRELTVVKKNGQRVALRPRQARSARSRWRCRKRPVDPERVERVVNGIVRRLESSGESEIPSTQIGELVMDALRALDPVAYVRFASVYRNFREARDFEEFISDLAETTASRTDAMMRAALALARRSLGRTWPNPAVGCVIVKDGVIVGRGRTQDGGRPHAEADALDTGRRRGARRHGLRHARALLAFRQVAALRRCPDRGRRGEGRVGDGRSQSAGQRAGPRPPARGRHRRRGRRGREGGGRDQRRDSCCSCARGRPLFHLKMASSLDGRIATASGESKWITGAAARADGQRLRATHDAILVGANTVAADDPELTCRLPGLDSYSPVRIVLDSKARMSPGSKLALTANKTPVWLLCTADAPAKAREALQAKGVQVIEVASNEQGRVDIAAGVARARRAPADPRADRRRGRGGGGVPEGRAWSTA